MHNSARIVKLSELLTERKEKPDAMAILTGQIPIVAKIAFNTGRIELRTETNTKTEMISIEPGDLVISGINAAKGAIAIFGDQSTGPVAATIHYSSYIINKERANPTYLWYFMRSNTFRRILLGSSTDGIKTEVKPNRFLQIEIQLPSLGEQERVVAWIECLMKSVEEVRKVKTQSLGAAEKLINVIIYDLFTRGKESGWVEEPLGSYVVDDRYGTSEKATDDTSGTPILRMGNIQNGRLVLQDLKYLRLSDRDRAKLLLKKGDVLVNRTNSAELVGKCAVFDLEGEYAFASYLIRLRLSLAKAEPRLVASYINSPAGREYMFSKRKQVTGQANVNATKLKALPIALPPLQEQRQIVAYLETLWKKVDELKELQHETEKDIEELIPTLIDDALQQESQNE